MIPHVNGTAYLYLRKRVWCRFTVLLKSQANLDIHFEVLATEYLFIYSFMVYLTTLPVAQGVGLKLRITEV
jgi:hypothetical protein